MPADQSRRVPWLLAVGVGLAALNLRVAITSVGPVLDEITTDLRMSSTGAGLLTTLPVLCFAVFGACTPTLIRVLGERRLLVGALGTLSVGLATRVLVDTPILFLVLSTLALSGSAVGNVLLPTVVKRLFPHRVGLMTTVYTTSLASGTALAAAATVPIEQAAGGSWRIALGSYAAFGAVAALPWLLTLRHEPAAGESHQGFSARQVLSTAMGWQSLLFFGSQSTIAYVMFGWFPQLLRDHGMSAASSGVLLSYLTSLAIPVSLIMPGIMARRRDHRAFIAAFFGCYVAGFLGLWTAPVQGAWVWATLIGIGMATFPLALTLLAVRTRTAGGTAALSAVSQSLGYLIAGTGPFAVGLFRELSGGWQVPLLLLIAVATLNFGMGMLIGRPRYLEDALAARAA